MTASDACTVLVDTTRALSAARRERDSWKLLAQQAIHFANEQAAELDRVRAAYHQLLDERRQHREAA